MSERYALVKNGVTQNVIVWDGETELDLSGTPFADCEIVPADLASPIPPPPVEPLQE
jgi:hypothetical protein